MAMMGYGMGAKMGTPVGGGLSGQAQQFEGQAMGALGTAAHAEEERNIQNKQIAQQSKAGGASAGATAGAMAGSFFGPWGMAIGAVVGGIGGYLAAS